LVKNWSAKEVAELERMIEVLKCELESGNVPISYTLARQSAHVGNTRVGKVLGRVMQCCYIDECPLLPAMVVKSPKGILLVPGQNFWDKAKSIGAYAGTIPEISECRPGRLPFDAELFWQEELRCVRTFDWTNKPRWRDRIRLLR
jgi:hypothetical protein